MDNFKLISDSRNDNQSNQLSSEKLDHANGKLSSLELISNLPSKSDSASMLKEVTDHFENTFSNVAKGEASASEYLEVGAIAIGTVAAGAFAAGRLMQRSTPLLFGRSERVASTGTALGEQTNAILTNGIKIERNSPALDAIVNNGVKIGEVRPALDALPSGVRNPAALDAIKANGVKISEGFAGPPQPLRPFDGFKFSPNPEGFKFNSSFITDKGLNGYVQKFARYGGEDKMHFNLTGSPITDQGLGHLLQLKHRLATVNLTGTHVTENGIRTLRQALPNAEIICDRTQGITPLGSAIANASRKAPIKPWERASYNWVPPRDIAEEVFKR